MDEYAGDAVAEDFAENMPHCPPDISRVIMDFLRKQASCLPDDSDDKFDTMLDAGCGSGGSTRVFAPHFRDVVGLDPSEAQIRRAMKIGGGRNITYTVGRGECLPAEDCSIDLIVSAFAVQYMDLQGFISECNRVLKDSGCASLFGYECAEVNVHQRCMDTGLSCIPCVDLFNEYYIKPLYSSLQLIGHPDTHCFDRMNSIFQKIQGMKKERHDEVVVDHLMSLQQLKDLYRAVPAHRDFENSLAKQGIHTLELFAEELKKRCGLIGVNDKNVIICVKFSVFIIFLTKLVIQT